MVKDGGCSLLTYPGLFTCRCADMNIFIDIYFVCMLKINTFLISKSLSSWFCLLYRPPLFVYCEFYIEINTHIIIKNPLTIIQLLVWTGNLMFYENKNWYGVWKGTKSFAKTDSGQSQTSKSLIFGCFQFLAF